jgi:putative ABC transport system permease protein
MVLGNTMNGMSLDLDTRDTGLARGCRAVEAWLLAGRTRWKVPRPFTRQALRAGFTPIINAMAATGLSVLGATFGSLWRVTDARHRLRLDRLNGGSR